MQKLYSLSQESGRSAAKYFVNSNPKFFTKDFAEPHVPVRSTHWNWVNTLKENIPEAESHSSFTLTAPILFYNIADILLDTRSAMRIIKVCSHCVWACVCVSSVSCQRLWLCVWKSWVWKLLRNESSWGKLQLLLTCMISYFRLVRTHTPPYTH